MNCLFFMTVTSEQKRPDTEVVQSNGHSLSLSFGAASECGREGRLPPLSLGSPEAQRGRATLRGVLSEAGVTAPRSGGLQGFGFGRSPHLARTRTTPPPQKLKTLGFISAASARKPGSAQAQCLPPQSRTEEGGSGAQHLRSGLSRINTKSLLYLPSNLNLSKFPLAVLELREEEILPTL